MASPSWTPERDDAFPATGLFVPKPSCHLNCLRYITADLGATVRQHPLASIAVGGGCYSLRYSVAFKPVS